MPNKLNPFQFIQSNKQHGTDYLDISVSSSWSWIT